MLYLKKEKGITIIALVITVIVLVIIAGISITQGTKLISTTRVESYVTDMITIRAKAKVYAEEINAEIWDATDKSEKRAQLYLEKYNMNKITDSGEITSKVDGNINDSNGCECYGITNETLKKMGLDKLSNEIQDGEYVVVYNASDYSKLDIVCKNGIQYDGKNYYTLSSLQSKVGEE